MNTHDSEIGLAERPSAGADTQRNQKTASTDCRLARLWENLLGIDNVTIDQNFFDLGGDSSLAVRMFAEIDKMFGVTLPLATLYETPTIQELSQVIQGNTVTSGWSPLVPIQPQGSRPALFCFHGAGGNVLIYRELSRRLGLDQPFFGLQAQGLDGNLAPLTTVEAMATLYCAEITRVRPRGPYFLAGYCGGGTIAYEVAQQLQAAGEEVALLAMFDTMNWSKIPITVWSKMSYSCQRLLFHAATFLSLDIRSLSAYLHDKIEILKSRIPVWRGMWWPRFSKNGKDSKSTELILGRIWKLNDLACWQYFPAPYAGKVTDFRPSRQYRIFDKQGLKWEELARGGQDVIILPVYPASMLIEPFVGHLAEHLKGCIERAMQRGAGAFSTHNYGNHPSAAVDLQEG